MTRLSKRQRDLLWDIISKRDLGDVCRICGRYVSKTKSINQGVLDCKDNSGDHSQVDNLQILCRSCNAIKNPRGPAVYKNQKDMSAAHAKNLISEPMFRAFVRHLIDGVNVKSYDTEDLIAAGCELVNCSTESGERYLKKINLIFWPLYNHIRPCTLHRLQI